MIVWIGSKNFFVVAAPTACTSPRFSAARISSRIPALPAAPSIPPPTRSRYFSVTISRIGPTFWAMPPWTSTSYPAISAASLRLQSRLIENAVIRQQPPAARAKFRIALAGDGAGDQFHAGPNAAAVLPAAARAAEPFAQNRARRHQPPLGFLQLPGRATSPAPSRACRRQSAPPADSSKPPAGSLWECC